MNNCQNGDSEDEDWNDDEADVDGNDTDEEPTVPCPSCRREILEDSPWCPYCEHYVSAEDRAGPRKPFWVIATALVCLAIALWWVFVAQTKGGQEITTREEVHGDSVDGVGIRRRKPHGAVGNRTRSEVARPVAGHAYLPALHG